MLLGGAALIVAGAFLGFVDLIRTGAFAIVLSVFMWTLVMVALPAKLGVRRTMHPRPPRVGQQSKVTVALESSRASLLPAAITEDSNVATHRWQVRHLEAGTTLQGYQHTPSARGVWDSGRLRLSLRDPLGLMHVDSTHGAADSWLVWPVVDSLDARAPQRVGDGDDSLARLNVMHAGVPGAGIREYARGDDIRLVHWAATAHRGELMVRQLDPPASPSVVLALAGTSSGFGEDDAFEWLVRAMASTASHFADARVEFDAHIAAATTFDRESTLNALARVQDSSLPHALPRDRVVVAFVHSNAKVDFAPSGPTPAIAVVAGPSAHEQASTLAASGWTVLEVTADDLHATPDSGVAPVMAPVLSSLGGLR